MIAFDGDAVHALSVAFDAICEELLLPECTRFERKSVAARVIEHGRRGLLEPSALRDRVLKEAGKASAR